MQARKNTLALLSAATLTALGATQSVSADTVSIHLESEKGIAGKPAATLGPVVITGAKGVADTFFFFHPGDSQKTPFEKNLQTQRVSPDPITHNYLQKEEHDTTGSVTYDLQINKVTVGSIDTYNTLASVSATINPGSNEKKEDVRVHAEIKDPFAFSDLPTANFPFISEGIDMSLTLLAGTAFPDVFSPDGVMPGAIAGGTSMTLTARVAAGELTDPDAFWDDALAGAIELYELVLVSDEDHVVTAALSFGASTAAFALDYLNHLGNPFDPTNVADVMLIEDFIEAAFVDGVLTSTLTDLLTVGFVPQTGVSAYTAGNRDRVLLTAVEVAEPRGAALLLVGLAGLLLSCHRRRSRACVRHPATSPRV